MTPRLSYVIVIVSDMERAVAFYRDTLDLPLRFASPGWSEFETGSTVLALHPGSPREFTTSGSPAAASIPQGGPTAGIAQLGLTVPSLDDFHRAMEAKGVKFTMPPTKQDFGGRLAKILDPDGATISVSEPMEPRD